MTLADLRSDEQLNLAPSVREIRWQDDPPSWGLYGANQNLTCVIENIGFFVVELADDRIVEEVDSADDALLYFLEHFDREPRAASFIG